MWQHDFSYVTLTSENLADTSTSSEEDEIDSRPSEIEMRILQKELDACNEQSQLLKERNRVSFDLYYSDENLLGYFCSRFKIVVIPHISFKYWVLAMMYVIDLNCSCR